MASNREAAMMSGRLREVGIVVAVEGRTNRQPESMC
jgi:hypothetical protein